MGDYQLGQIVQTQDGRQGVIRYVGETAFAEGQWIGIELADPNGKNDGSVQGNRYFTCQPKHGVFVHMKSQIQILQQPPSRTSSNGARPANGSVTKPRPSSGITPDVARKRQSLMSAGGTSGSRLSLRSPTRSPVKPVHSSASSNASTPRTGTPATTARTSDGSTKSRTSVSGRPSMGPPPAARATTSASRPSLGGTTANNTKGVTGSKVAPRTATLSSRLSTRPFPQVRGVQQDPTPSEQGIEDTALSEPITEEDEDAIAIRDTDSNHVTADDDDTLTTLIPAQSSRRSTQANGTASTSHPTRPPATAGTESRAASQREIEQYKATIQTLERKRQADREKLKSVDSLQAEKNRYENIIQALQEKLKSNKQAMSELQQKYEEAEKVAGQVDSKSAEHESELELANIDKEMAEERAESFEMELNALKSKYEEVQLEIENLREENAELGSEISPEEKASAGWLQIERDRERLRDALMLLRDMSQQTENDLKQQVKELQHDLDESLEISQKYRETVEQLARAETANRHLKDQLDDIDANEELHMALEAEREQHQSLIEELREQIQTLQEGAKIDAELEAYHLTTEEELQEELNEQTALLNEKERTTHEQSKRIEEMQYTLTKFREIVNGLQEDIDQLRRSKDITESEAHEMSSKSRAMMDLNRQLQTSAAKTQFKAIDLEIGRMRAEESAQHLTVVQTFVPDSFEPEKNPVLSMLCLQRIKSKATLVMSLVRDRLKDRPHLTQDDPFSALESIEKLGLIATISERFVHFIRSSQIDEFVRLQNVAHELEPVERSINGWIENLKRDELSREGPEHLSRMVGILTDLVDKFVPDRPETRATQHLANTKMLETYCDGTTNAIHRIASIVDAMLGPPNDDNAESSHFDKKWSQYSSKARTIKYLAGKAAQNLEDLQSRNMILDYSVSPSFEVTEQLAHDISQLVRKAGVHLLHSLSDEERAEPWTYSDVSDLISSALRQELQPDADAVDLISARLHELHARVDELVSKSSDFSSTTEYERLPAPWIVRSQEIKRQKVDLQETQDELRKLKTQAQEWAVTLIDKDRELEEKQIRVELLESRTKDSKQHSDKITKLEAEIAQVKTAREEAIQELKQTRSEHDALLTKTEVVQLELDTLKKSQAANGDQVLLAEATARDHAATAELESHIALLNTEILNLQAAVRYLQMQNHRVRLPASHLQATASAHAWLDPSTLSCPPKMNTQAAPIRDMYTDLLHLAATAKPISLAPPPSVQTKSSWRATKDTPRYKAFRQREQLEQWLESRKAVAKSSYTRWRSQRRDVVATTVGLPRVKDESDAALKMEKSGDGVVEIVDSPPL